MDHRGPARCTGARPGEPGPGQVNRGPGVPGARPDTRNAGWCGRMPRAGGPGSVRVCDYIYS